MFFFFQAEDGIRDDLVTGVQTCALPISCDPANPKNFEFKSKGGLYRYGMYERATLPEEKAREAAPVIFVGPVRFLGMELSVGFTGRPQDQYPMFLPSGHKATVDMDSVVRRLNKAEVN